MAPGSYYLELTVSGKTAGDQPYKGVETIDFGVAVP
jgi:hypothetical protein